MYVITVVEDNQMHKPLILKSEEEARQIVEEFCEDFYLSRSGLDVYENEFMEVRLWNILPMSSLL